MFEKEIYLNHEDLKEGVTVLVTTFEHENYIEDCIKSILFQQTNFPVYIFVYVDLSKDKTSQKVRSLQKENANKITVFENKARLYGGVASILHHKYPVNTKYWCILDGDDYWSSPLKLSLQVNVLKNNPQAIGTCCRYQILNNGEISESKGPDYKYFNYAGKWFSKRFYMGYAHTSSILWKNINRYKNTPFPRKFIQLGRGDTILEMTMLKTFGYMICTKEAMSIYRITGKGMWTSLSKNQRDSNNKDLEIKLAKALDFRIKLSNFLFNSNKFMKKLHLILTRLKIIPNIIAKLD